MDEVAARYTLTPVRASLWTRFEAFLNWVAQQIGPPACCLIDGGFTSDKASPKDIDVVFDLTGCDDAVRNFWFFVYANERNTISAQFGVDFWVYFPGANRDLRAFFEYVKPEEAISRGMQPDDRKGVLRIVL